LHIALPFYQSQFHLLGVLQLVTEVHFSPRLLVNCPLLPPIAPANPSPSNRHPSWVFPRSSVLLIRMHSNPLPTRRNKKFWIHSMIVSLLPSEQCCGSVIIFSGSAFESGSGLFMKNTLEVQMI
jgi:hypothetical protein